MENAVTYQKALAEGIIQEGHYFLVKYPNGKEALFRLVKREEGYVMWGPPTEGEILLEGKEGYDNFFALADAKAREEYSSKGVFKEVHAIGGPKKDYEFHSIQEYREVQDEMQKYLKDFGNTDESYFLASRCVGIYGPYAYFRVFIVNSGNVNAYTLYNSYGGTDSPTSAVRPEATPESTLLLKTTESDGSEEKPWICIGSEEEKPTREEEKQEEAIRGEEVQEEKATESCITGKGEESVSKDELLRLIMENAVTYQKALAEGIIQEGHYFLVKYPNGKEALFRLVKREEGYVMCGPPTEGKICPIGKEGYDNFFTLADAKARKEYSYDGVFKEVHALGGPKKDYEVHSSQKYRKVRAEIQEYIKDLGYTDESYFIASRCVFIDNHYACFHVFLMYGQCGGVDADYLSNSYGETWHLTGTVRPEATPESTLLLKTTGCDGSEEKPWICIGSGEEKPTREKEKQEESPQERKKQEEAISGEAVQEEKATESCITGKGEENVSKDELLSLITENTVTYQKALAEGIIQEGHYFLVNYPNGKEALFRLVKREEGYVMYGPPTKGKICLKGKEGYDNLFTLADAKASEEYSYDGVFKEVHAIGGPKKDYEVHSSQEHRKVLDEIQEYLKVLGNADESYFLASRCVHFYSIIADFCVFRVHSGSVYDCNLYSSLGNSWSLTLAVRPKATPESALLLKTTESDGSEERPWICIGSEEEKPTREK